MISISLEVGNKRVSKKKILMIFILSLIVLFLFLSKCKYDFMEVYPNSCEEIKKHIKNAPKFNSNQDLSYELNKCKFKPHNENSIACSAGPYNYCNTIKMSLAYYYKEKNKNGLWLPCAIDFNLDSNTKKLYILKEKQKKIIIGNILGINFM